LLLPYDLEKKTLVFAQIFLILLLYLVKFIREKETYKKINFGLALGLSVFMIVELFNIYPWTGIKSLFPLVTGLSTKSQEVFTSARTLDSLKWWLENLTGTFVSGKFSAPTPVMFFVLIGYAIITYFGLRELNKKLRGDIYKNIFKITGIPKSIVDLGSGLNPFSCPYMSMDNLSYYAYDIDKKDIGFLNIYFELMKNIRS